MEYKVPILVFERTGEDYVGRVFFYKGKKRFHLDERPIIISKLTAKGPTVEAVEKQLLQKIEGYLEKENKTLLKEEIKGLDSISLV